MIKYSQSGQDKFVLSLFNKDYKGVFVDVGCRLPEEINNTILLEENGWTGLSIDIVDYSNEWKVRTNPFICQDALNCDYKELFTKYNLPNIIDYLSLDIEGSGLRYLALKKVVESKYEFKVITIEHDAYRGHDTTERIPQRNLLNDLGYFLLCADVTNEGNPFEDWWINPKYFKESDYLIYKCSNMDYSDILNRIKNK